MLMKEIKHMQEGNGTGGNSNSSDNGNGNLKRGHGWPPTHMPCNGNTHKQQKWPRPAVEHVHGTCPWTRTCPNTPMEV